MNNICPNCGAPMNMNECGYCGTMLLNLVDIDVQDRKPVYLKIRHNGKIICAKTVLNEMNVSLRPRYTDLATMDGRFLKKLTENELDIECSFHGLYE